jgi:enoyl-CoA hydratase
MGRRQTVQSAFAMHHLAHAHNQLKFGIHVDPFGLPETVRQKFEARMGISLNEAKDQSK